MRADNTSEMVRDPVCAKLCMECCCLPVLSRKAFAGIFRSILICTACRIGIEFSIYPCVETLLRRIGDSQ